MSQHSLGRPYEKAASWLLASFEPQDGYGSSAWYSRVLHPVRGWSYPYPETTGYVIPTLYHLLAAYPESFPDASEHIERSVRWLLSLQLPNGAFPGGHAAGRGRFYLTTQDYLRRTGRPAAASIFNSGQILRGLLAHHRHTGSTATLGALRRCARYLLDSVGSDGSWRTDAYSGSSSPSFFAYVTSSLLEAGEILTDKEEVREKGEQSMRFLMTRLNPGDGFVRGMGFQGRDQAFTHTIGYMLEGVIDSSSYLPERKYECLELVERALDRIVDSASGRERLPGKYAVGWQADPSFSCVTGNCQVALCLVKLGRLIGRDDYLEVAGRLLQGATKAQAASGGFPGSLPLRGEYMKWRYPNWAAKYYMDLVVAMHRTEACG